MSEHHHDDDDGEEYFFFFWWHKSCQTRLSCHFLMANYNENIPTTHSVFISPEYHPRNFNYQYNNKFGRKFFLYDRKSLNFLYPFVCHHCHCHSQWNHGRCHCRLSVVRLCAVQDLFLQAKFVVKKIKTTTRLKFQKIWMVVGMAKWMNEWQSSGITWLTACLAAWLSGWMDA